MRCVNLTRFFGRASAVFPDEASRVRTRPCGERNVARRKPKQSKRDVLDAVREPRQDFGEHQAPRRKIVSTGLHAAAGSDYGLILKRNCSISPRDLLWILASIALVTCGIGVAFASLGAWLVLPFAGIEVLAVAAAFYLNGVHAADHERLVLRDGKLVVEICEAERVARYEFPS